MASNTSAKTPKLKQVVTIPYDTFNVKKKFPIWTRTKEYRFNDIVALRIYRLHYSAWGVSDCLELRGWSGGILVFDYEDEWVRFGAGMDEAETKLVIKEIEKKWPKTIDDTKQ